MSEFDHYLNDMLGRAAGEARAEGSATVEAQHLLLAMADEFELGRDAMKAALEQESARSRAVAGVTVAPPTGAGPPVGTPGLGATAKAALERGFASVRRKKDIGPRHVLLGVVLAEAGTVPRALALAGVDRQALIERLR